MTVPTQVLNSRVMRNSRLLHCTPEAERNHLARAEISCERRLSTGFRRLPLGRRRITWSGKFPLFSPDKICSGPSCIPSLDCPGKVQTARGRRPRLSSCFLRPSATSVAPQASIRQKCCPSGWTNLGDTTQPVALAEIMPSLRGGKRVVCDQGSGR